MVWRKVYLAEPWQGPDWRKVMRKGASLTPLLWDPDTLQLCLGTSYRPSHAYLGYHSTSARDHLVGLVIVVPPWPWAVGIRTEGPGNSL